MLEIDLLRRKSFAEREASLTLATGEVGIIVAMINVNTVTPIVFRRVAGAIGRAQDIGDALARLGDRYQPDAHPDAENPFLPQEAKLRDRPAHLVRDPTCPGECAVLHQHPELVSPEPRQRVALSHGHRQRLPELSQQLVPRHVAAGIVDNLELVQIQIAKGVLGSRLS